MAWCAASSLISLSAKSGGEPPHSKGARFGWVTGAKADHKLKPVLPKPEGGCYIEAQHRKNSLTPEGVSYRFATAGTKAGAASACRLHSGATLRARTDVDADNRFAVILHGVEAVLAQGQGQLIFALGVETAVTLRTSREGRAVAQFANVNFWMNFKSDHENSLGSAGARAMPEMTRRRRCRQKSCAGVCRRMRDFPQDIDKDVWNHPLAN
jgi:hypothetical protein